MSVARLSINDALKLRKMAEAQQELATLLTTLLDYMVGVEERLKALERPRVYPTCNHGGVTGEMPDPDVPAPGGARVLVGE